MKYITQFLSLLLLLTLSSIGHAAPKPKRIIYTGDPLKVTIGVNEERRFTFPDTEVIYADISEKLINEGMITKEVVGKNVYITATKPFKLTRFVFGEENGTDVYFIDIQAVQQKVGSQRLIIVKGEDRYAVADKDKEVVPETVIKPLKNPFKTPTAGYKTLINFAVREVYAPQRLRGGVKGIYPETINTQPVYHLLRDNQTLVTPVAAWRSGGLHVTALSVVNKTKKSLTLNPIHKRGSWLATTFFPRGRLLPQGHPHDNTTLFLVSKEAFIDAISSNPMITIGRR